MSRNAPVSDAWRTLSTLLGLLGLSCALAQPPSTLPLPPANEASSRVRVVAVRDSGATEAFRARPERVTVMVNRGLTNLTGQTTATAAWRQLLSTQDLVGIKVYSGPGAHSGTRPAVVAALVESLLEAQVPAKQIVVWDRFRNDLRQAGYFELGSRYGISVQGCDGAGFDETTFYLPDSRIIGQLVAGDLEFGRKGENVGLKSFVSRLVTQQMTKIINVAPLLNHNRAGLSGTLYSLAMGSVDNRIRFEVDAGRLASAVPELYALPSLGDRVVLHVLDALVCQYQGEKEPKLHYATALNELWFSRDPLALDLLGLQALDRQRKTAGLTPVSASFMDLYQNAALLELGTGEMANIQVERVE